MDLVGFIFNIITIGLDIITCLVSSVMLICILSHALNNRSKPEDKITILLCSNIYQLVLISAAISVSFRIQTLLGDLYEQDFYTSFCTLLGYFSPVLISTLYWTFANQAFYRLCRIVYSNRRWLQSFTLYLILPFIQLIFSGVLLSAVVWWHDIVYLSKQFYCYVPYTTFRSMLWILVNAYGVPLLVLSLIYLRITIYLRHQPNPQTFIGRQRQDRDLLVVRRILTTVTLLMALGIPTMIYLVVLVIGSREYPPFMRISWFFVGFSMMGLSFSTIISTPQLKRMIMQKLQRTRIEPLNGVPLGILPSRITHNPA